MLPQALLTTLGTVALGAAILSPAASAGVANGGLPGAPAGNPLAGMPWGNYNGSQDEVFPAYYSSSGRNHSLLGKIALRPRARWFGYWYPNSEAERTAREYIDNVTRGNPNVLAQAAIFRLDPWEGQALRHLPSPGQQNSYRRWIDAFASGIGSSRMAIILQPDLPIALWVPRHSTLPLQLVSYAARRFSALPHTTVYIDVGAADWPTVGEAVRLLRLAGVRYTRGFALNSTHYDTTENEVRFGGAVSSALARAGLPGKHFVVNTASNGQGFTFQQYHRADFDNARVCRTRADRRCVTLGIPPTTRVADRRWRLSPRARRIAAGAADAYLWFGRPWLYNQSDPFDLSRSLALARTAPFA